MKMRIATFRAGGRTRLGVVRDERIVDLVHVARVAGIDDSADELHDMLALIAGGQAALERVIALAANATVDAEFPLELVQLLAPISRPRKNVFCVGRNYAEHAAESFRAAGKEVKLPTAPNIFTKAVTAINDPYGDIPFDASVSEQIDWECELAVIIGQGGRHISREEALEHVWGYTVLNDVSARDIQNRPGMQWFLGKSLDGSCPIGPWIVTADEIPNPRNLHLHLTVNGAMKQEDTTANLLFDVPAIIEELSRALTLEPGDIIATGTPAGVGFARTPPEFLKPGDIVETTIAEIGTMRNRVVSVGESAEA
jgi:2-keto-4-pentenoate hydratase/2-oxohepta-3-ene-1,7-dioic acid hydratase in catechol pathway